MKISAPFIDQAGRRRTLYRYYHVQPKPKKVPLTHGQNVAKQLCWLSPKCVLLFGATWALLVLWPIGERISR